jgi:glycosyltransferase involved in cell wall biosynthesis
MRVLLTHDRFAPDFAGGGEYVVLETARHLRRRGIEVRVLTTGDPAIEQYEDVPTRRLPIHRYRMNLAIAQIAEAACDVDLIQTFTYHACLPSVLVGRRLGKPVFCGVLSLFDQTWKEMRGPLVGQFFMRMERLIMTRRFARFLFLSERSRQLGIAMGAPAERSIVTPMGIDHERYRPASEKADHVLFVGKLEVRKGIQDVLAAAAALPHVPFHVIGWGGDESALRRAAPPNVTFVPFVRGAPLQEAFGRARIFLLPSRAEGFPVALLEAMTSGCAIVCTLPFHFAGEQPPEGDVPALAAAVDRLWRDREASAAMGRRNRELSLEYSWERYGARLERTYREVLAAGQPDQVGRARA